MSSTNDLVSIIVPVYNAEQYLIKCVDSILSQTYANIEIILVDDGSVDGSAKIMDKYQSSYPNVVCIHKKNEGISATRNAGLELAKGKYIVFIDSDDIVDCRMVELCADTLYNTQSDIVGFSWQNFSDADDLPKAHFSDKLIVKTGKKIMPYFLTDNRLYCAVRYVYKKSILDKFNICFKKEIKTGGEDQLFIYNYIKHCDKAVFLDYNGYFYFNNEKSATGGKVKPNHYNDLSVRKFIVDDVDKKNISRAKAHLMKGYLAFLLKAIKYGTTCEEDIVTEYRKIIKKNLTRIMFSPYIRCKYKAAALSVALSLKTTQKLIKGIDL